MSQLMPNKHCIVCRLLDAKETTEGGLYIPQKERETNRAQVLYIGREVSEYKEGDTILFGKFGGSRFEYEGREYLLLREDEVLVRVTGETDEDE